MSRSSAAVERRLVRALRGPALRGTLRIATTLAVAAAFSAPRAWGQDFAVATPAAAEGGTAGWLESGLPPGRRGVGVAAFATRWQSLPDLGTRGVSASVGIGAARAAAGWSQTGAPGLGWNAAAVALGLVVEPVAVGARAVARRDRLDLADASAVNAAPRDGFEVGFGARAEVAPGVSVWASAPQVWLAGAAPPLRRALELGLGVAMGELRGWWARRTVPALARGMRAEHSAGVAIAGVPLTVWIEARDQPLRGGLGVRAQVRPAWLSVAVESHPVLGETLRAAVGVGGEP